VLLIHNFDLKKGGGSSQPGWSDLAKTLHEEGYTVLSFDFRGFGESKTVDKQFWTFPQNSGGLIRGALKKGDTLDHKNFTAGYVRYLVNDIAAAKAYLDRRNDAKELNSSNVVLIGAGEGAALGSMWLANECRRRRDTNVPPFGAPALAPQSEINDIACAVWLTISPKAGPTTGVSRWVTEAGKKNKVPMAFIYGKDDKSGKTLAESFVKSLKSTGDKSLSGSFGVPGTKLTGHLLLDSGLEKFLPSKEAKGRDDGFLVKYLDKVLTERGNKEQKDRKSEASAYWYVNALGRPMKMSKRPGAEAPVVDFTIFQ